MTAQTPASGDIFGRDVVDSSGSRLGTVDGVWVDDATNALEFLGVKIGKFMGKTHVMPAVNANVNSDPIQMPYSEQQIKDAPSFGSDDELSPDDEERIYSYYGVDRSTAPSPTGLPGGNTGQVDTTSTRGQVDTVDNGDRDMTLSEESLQVGKRRVEAGRARIRKVVRTEHVEQPVELSRDDVSIERVAAGDAQVPSNAFQEEEIDVPLMREEPVVETEAHVRDRVRVNRDVETETQTVEGDVRREDVDVDQERGLR